MDKEKIKFSDLSGWLKTVAVLGSIQLVFLVLLLLDFIYVIFL